METKIDVAVVGGGLSGLAVAALLAKQGREVTVFEGSMRAGGYAQSPALHGLPVNLGPHALYLGGAAVQVLEGLGVKWNGHAPPLKGAKVWNEGHLWPLPGSAWSLLRSPLLDWSGRMQLAKVLLPLIASPKVAARADQTLDDWLDAVCPSPSARGVLQMLFRLTTYSNAPLALSARRACEQLHLGLARNVTYLDGGFASLVAGLEALPGVKVIHSKAARSVHSEGRLVFDDVTLTANLIVLAVPLEVAVKLTSDGALGRFQAQAVRGEAACLDLVLSSLPNPQQQIVLGVDQPLYASVHAQRPEGVVLQAARYLAPGEDGASARPGLEAMLDAFQPGWRERVVAQRFLPQLQVTSAIPLAANGGRGFGVKLSEKVFLASDYAVGGFLSDGGLQAAREIASVAGSSVRLSA